MAGDALGCDRASHVFPRENPRLDGIGHEPHRDGQRVAGGVLGRACLALTVDSTVLEVGSEAPMGAGNHLEPQDDVLNVVRNGVIVVPGVPDRVAICLAAVGE
jgi:hypothetical protein